MKAIWRIAAGLLGLLATTAQSRAEERILSFISDVAIARNSDLTVAEIIRVQVEGKILQRGILREIPLHHVRRDGTPFKAGFELLSVTRNGAVENAVAERTASGVRIRAGLVDYLLPHGPHAYIIRYRLTGQVRFFPDFDELHWNVTGSGWVFPIDAAEARISLPDKVPFRQTAFYTGPDGAQGTDAAVFEQRPGHIVFRTTQPLPLRHGFTVAAGWDKGVVSEPAR